MKTNPYDLVYPSEEPNLNTSGSIAFHHGLTKREHFAALAMQGLIANPALSTVVDKEPVAEAVARVSVQLANALIKELNKEKK